MRVYVAIIFALFWSSSTALADSVPVEYFGELANVRGVTISPGGTKLAMLIGSRADERSIVVKAIGGKATRIPAGKDNARFVRFLNDDRIAVYYDKYSSRFGGRFRFADSRLIFMNLDGTKQKQVYPAAGFRFIEGDSKHCLMSATASRTKSGIPRNADDQMVDRYPAIYKIDVNTGKGRLVERGQPDTGQLILDPYGKARIRVKGKGFRRKADIRMMSVEVKDQKSGRWRELLHYSNLDDAPFGFAGFGDDNTVYLIGRFTGVPGYERDKIAIFTLDLTTGEIKVFRENANVDMGGTITDRYTHRVVGFTWDDGYARVEYLDPLLASLQTQLEAAFKGKEVSISTWDRNRTRFIVKVSGPGHSGIFYMVQPAQGKVTLIAREYPKIPKTSISKTEFIHYAARDGVKIPAYLTMPAGRGAKNLPMIILPHGGPRARDSYSSELWRQSFASMGYVVLQPQYRGSEGFGLAWRDAGNEQWGRRMQNDLSDGVKYLVNQGVVDSKRVCIAGWSYGGYAAMAGATLTPELYSCVIAGAGVSDLIKSLKNSGSGRTQSRAAITEWWEESIGNPSKVRQQLKDTSPAYHADKVRAPILLIHGEQDTVVPIDQSIYFAKALKAAGKPYQFLRLPNENHHLEKGETRVKQLKAMAAFLKKNNPAYIATDG